MDNPREMQSSLPKNRKPSCSMMRELEAGIRACGLRGSGVVAVSGGADSVALLLGMLELQNQQAFSLSVAHLNHGLRGAESDDDAAWVQNLSDSLGLPCDIERVELSGIDSSGGSLEERARNSRLDFFSRIALHRGATWVATAHQNDDLVETVLHNLIRGTGLRGLRGIPRRRKLVNGVDLVRPFLTVTRSAVRQFLEEREASCREDTSNLSMDFTRNRIRHQLLPFLKSEFNVRVSESLSRLAGQALEWEELLAKLASGLLKTSLLEHSGNDCRLIRNIWLTEDSNLILQESLRMIWSNAGWPLKKMGERQWKDALSTIREGGKLDLPEGVRIHAREDLIRIFRDPNDQ